MEVIDKITLASREYDFNDYTVLPLEIDEDPSGQLRGGVGSTIWDAAIVLAKYLERSDLLSTISVAASQSSRPIQILELGSGTGIVGLSVARMLSTKGIKARIVLTDKENCMPLLERNIDKNPSKDIELVAQMLDWEVLSGIKSISNHTSTAGLSGSQEGGAKGTQRIEASSSLATSLSSTDSLLHTEWDMVILSDCIWVPALYPPLISSLNKLIQPGHNNTQLVIAFEKRNFSEEMEFFAMLGKTFRFRDVKPEEQDANYQSEDIYLFLCQRRS
ncbi:Methyltransferase-like protein 21D [Mortierella sp. GBA30]|nr:Methyltransferase-like protein 21D [Mortierella sp. GBA30]